MPVLIMKSILAILKIDQSRTEEPSRSKSCFIALVPVPLGEDVNNDNV